MKKKKRNTLPASDSAEKEILDQALSNDSSGKSQVAIAKITRKRGSNGLVNVEQNAVQLELTDATAKLDDAAAKKNWKKLHKTQSTEIGSSATVKPLELPDCGNKKTRGAADVSPDDVGSATADQTAREEAARAKKNAVEKQKANNRELRMRYKLDPSSLTNEEKIRAKALIRVFEATEAARAAQMAALTKGESMQGSNAKKRNRQAEIAAERKQTKLQKKQPTESAPQSVQQSAHVGRGVGGRGRGVTEGRGRGIGGRGVSGRGVSVSTDVGQAVQQRGRGRGMGGRGVS